MINPLKIDRCKKISCHHVKKLVPEIVTADISKFTGAYFKKIKEIFLCLISFLFF